MLLRYQYVRKDVSETCIAVPSGSSCHDQEKKETGKMEAQTSYAMKSVKMDGCGQSAKGSCPS